MIKILWLLESKINSDFINKISNELELKMQISSSFENGLIYDVIILENLSIISHLSEIQKNSILIYVLDEKNNIFDHQNIYVNYYIRNLSLYEDLYQAFLKSKDFLLKKINTISLKSGKINYHIIKNNILYIESYRNYIVIHKNNLLFPSFFASGQHEMDNDDYNVHIEHNHLLFYSNDDNDL